MCMCFFFCLFFFLSAIVLWHVLFLIIWTHILRSHSESQLCTLGERKGNRLRCLFCRLKGWMNTLGMVKWQLPTHLPPTDLKQPAGLPTTPSVSPLPHINQYGPAPSTIPCSSLMKSPLRRPPSPTALQHSRPSIATHTVSISQLLIDDDLPQKSVCSGHVESL